MKKQAFDWIDIDALISDFRARLTEKATALDDAAKRTAAKYETDLARLQKIIDTGEGDDTAKQNAERKLLQLFNPEQRQGSKVTDIKTVTGTDLTFATAADMSKPRLKGSFVFLYTVLSWYKEFGTYEQRTGAMLALDKIITREQSFYDGVKWLGDALAQYEQHKCDDLIRTMVRVGAMQSLTHLELFRRRELTSEAAARKSFAGHAAWRARTA